MAWTDEERAEAKELYLKEKPTPETTTEAVKAVASAMGKSPNGVRMILGKMEGVYVKAVGAKNPPKASGNGDDKPKRVSKADSADMLIKTLKAQAIELSDDDMATINRMTGKATQLIKSWIDNLLDLDEIEDEDEDIE